MEVPSQVDECGAGAWAWDPACARVARGLRLINLNPASESDSESGSESESTFKKRGGCQSPAFIEVGGMSRLPRAVREVACRLPVGTTSKPIDR